MAESLETVLQTLRPDSEHARGALDVLALLGLVTPGQPFSPTGKVAQMALDVLGAHVTDGVALGIAWEELDGSALRGVDIIRAIETDRAARVARPTPARVVEAAQAIFKTRRGDEDSYLMQFDAHAGRYQPIGGKREPGEDDLEVTLRRELAEELGLTAPPGEAECRLEQIGQSWAETAISATYGVLTSYTFFIYRAVDVRFEIKVDADTRWLSRSEMLARRADDGRAISPIFQQALGLEVLDELPVTQFGGKDLL
jgi:8-oxo-dGTP pyrophosphatase MutT (NUDIX family)